MHSTLIIAPPSRSDHQEELIAILAKLKTVPEDETNDTVHLGIRALQLSDAEAYDVLPFVEGLHVGSVQQSKSGVKIANRTGHISMECPVHPRNRMCC